MSKAVCVKAFSCCGTATKGLSRWLNGSAVRLGRSPRQHDGHLRQHSHVVRVLQWGSAPGRRARLASLGCREEHQLEALGLEPGWKHTHIAPTAHQEAAEQVGASVRGSIGNCGPGNCGWCSADRSRSPPPSSRSRPWDGPQGQGAVFWRREAVEARQKGTVFGELRRCL